MPSFDIVSNVDQHELTNAVDQANRELSNRFDFRGTKSSFKLAEATITLASPTDFQLKQMLDILQSKLTTRGIDIRALEIKDPNIAVHQATQDVIVRQGIDKDVAKKLVKLIKDSKLKVQAAIQGEQVRVTGKKRDDLQSVITLLKEEKLELPLQYENFRD